MTIYKDGFSWVTVGNDDFYTQISPNLPVLIFPKTISNKASVPLGNNGASVNGIVLALFVILLLLSIIAMRKRR